ncbi:MAG: family 78 glycoside hydrolase catalytic domain, partial [Blautia sp.]|nr:family 78 glycoside hydrolase catalytic domain [Blautia sp.]
MYAINLKTEYLKNPMGIDIRNPRLMWNCKDGIRQSAYQIICKDDNEKILWDSGKVTGTAMQAVYNGERLKSRTKVLWKVRLWDENDQEGEWSQETFFELGLMARTNWMARWITGNYEVDRKKRYPVDCFLKEIVIEKEVRKARLYVTACGLYEARIDSRKVGNFCLAPGITDYRKRVQYQTYDVTDMVGKGSHRLTIWLADGWYRGSTGAWGLRNQYGTETKLLAQLELFYEDGTRRIIATDETWRWSNDGPIRFADNKDGEIVEAGRIPSYGGSAKVTSHPVIPAASDNVPVVEKERFVPKMSIALNGRKLFDFGQNMAGYLEFHVKAQKGQKIHIQCGELLDDEGNLTLRNIQCTRKDFATPLQRIEYTCREGENDYKTTFAVFGFQYAEVDTNVEITEEDITAIAVYSDIRQTGFFESSNPLLNRLVDMTAWSTRGNSLDIPTDCPTRERHGWTGDAQIFFETASYLFD